MLAVNSDFFTKERVLTYSAASELLHETHKNTVEAGKRCNLIVLVVVMVIVVFRIFLQWVTVIGRYFENSDWQSRWSALT